MHDTIKGIDWSNAKWNRIFYVAAGLIGSVMMTWYFVDSMFFDGAVLNGLWLIGTVLAVTALFMFMFDQELADQYR